MHTQILLTGKSFRHLTSFNTRTLQSLTLSQFLYHFLPNESPKRIQTAHSMSCKSQLGFDRLDQERNRQCEYPECWPHGLAQWAAEKACVVAGMEAEYMADVARQRRPVLMCVFIFDIAIYLFRLSFYGVNSAHQTFQSRLSTIMPQLMNMIALHSIVGWVNWRSRRLGSGSPREVTSCPWPCNSHVWLCTGRRNQIAKLGLILDELYSPDNSSWFV